MRKYTDFETSRTMAALERKAASGFAKLQTGEEEYLFVNL
jgi:hypothetical protein